MMTRVLLWAVFLVCPSLAQLNRLTPGEKQAGWQLLFDGETTQGWQEVTGKAFPGESWRVEDGCLRAVRRAGGFQDLRTAASFRSFEFQFEWKVEAGGNSGVKYLVQRVDEWPAPDGNGRHARARGLEYQLADDGNQETADPSRSCGSLYSLLAPVSRPAALKTLFNHSVLLVRGRHVEHWMNGVKLVDYETEFPQVQVALGKMRRAGSLVDESPICLQNHASAAWFRNLKIRVLTD